MSEKKEIKCQICDKTFNEAEVIVRTIKTDISMGLNWGVPSWEEYQVRSCPYCTYSLDLKLNKQEMKKLKDWYKNE